MLKHPILLVVLLALAILRASDRILFPSFAPSFYTVSSLHNFPSYSSSLPFNMSEPNNDQNASTTLLLSPDVLEQSTRAVEELLRDVGLIAHPLAVFGHILFVPASRHGADVIRSRLQLLAAHHIPVDLIALDAFWWHPLHYFQWHPQFYDVREHQMTFLQQQPRSESQKQAKPLYEDDEDAVDRRTTEAANVLIWVSCFLPTSTKEAQFAAKEGFLVTKEDRQPHLFSWSRSYSKKKNSAIQEGHDKDDEDLTASMTGVLLDVQNPHAAAWYSEQLAQFLEAHRTVVAGVRVGGVDSLLYGRRDLYHSRSDRDRTTATTTAKLKQIDPSEFTFSYYELIHRVMNRVRPDGSGIVLGRAVDSLGGPDGRPFHQYAPPAVVSTAWVGDHEFSVAGLRESAMNVLWSAKKGFGVLGTMIGPGVLPGLWRVEPHLVEREAERLQQERVQLSATLCVGSEPVVQQECEAHVQWLEEEENFLRQVHEAATYASCAPPSGKDAGENRARLQVHRARLCAYRRRQVQLFERWAQFSAFLPTMMESGGLTATSSSSISSEREGAEDTAHVLELQNMLMTIVHRLVQEHQALRLYFASHSMDGSKSRKRDHHRERSSTATATTRSAALLYPARSEEIHFAEPEGGGWALHVGPDLILIPVMDTLDDDKNAHDSRKEERVKQSPTRRRTFKLGKHLGDRNALRDFLDDDTSPWWTVWHDPTIILRESDRELTLEVPPPFSPPSSLLSSSLQKGQNSGPPLVLRRGGATVPLLLSRSSPQLSRHDNTSERIKKDGDEDANEEGSVGATLEEGEEGEQPPMVVLTVEQLWTGGVAATSSSGGPTNEPAQSVGRVALDPRGRVGGIRSTVTMQLLAKKINPPFPLHISWEVQSAVAQSIVLSLFDSVLLLDSHSPKAPRSAEEAQGPHRQACSCRFQQDERLRDMTGKVMFGEDAPSWLRSSSFVEANTEREQQEEECANYMQDSQLADTSPALQARFAWERHRLRPQLDASVTLANDRSRRRCAVVWDQSAGVMQLQVAMTYPGQNAQCDCKADVRLP